MRAVLRLAVLLAIVVGCESRSTDDRGLPPGGSAAEGRRGEIDAPPARPAYPAPPVAWQLGEVRGRFGRGVATQEIAALAIAGPGAPLRLPTPWAIPGDGPARAAIFGLEGERPAVELVDIDSGRVLWRDRTACAAPIVGVTGKAIVCADAKGIRAVGMDGAARWKSDATFVAITEDRIVTAAVDEAVIVDADSGDELARVKLPAAISVGTIVASCGDAGRELYGIANDRLVRIAEAAGGPKITWSAPIDELLAIDACEGATVIASLAHGVLAAFARDKGTTAGTIDGVRGFWPLGDRLAVATASGVASYGRDLLVPLATPLPALGELIAKRGTRRLVRASPHSAVLLDGTHAIAYLPFAENGAALGDRAILAATWSGSANETLHRLAIPPRWPKRLRVAATPGVAVPAELRDLPAAGEVGPSVDLTAPPFGGAAGRGQAPTVDLTAPPFGGAAGRGQAPTVDLTAPPFGGAAGRGQAPTVDSTPARAAAYALDPEEPGALYVAAASGELARADLAARRWDWVASGCKNPIALAIARDRIACASATAVHASTRSGAAVWDAAVPADALAAAGDVIVAFSADRAIALAARDGHRLGELASDDGAPVRAALIARGDATWLVTAERGRLVARLPHAGMLAAWSLVVDGTIASIAPSGEGVLVALDDGDAYRIELATARVIALPGLGLGWQASGELVIGTAIGGPLPAPLPPPVVVKRVGPPPKPDPEAAPMSVPIVPPPSLGDSFELTLYALHGGLRTRNDYAIGGAIAPRVAGAPIAIAGAREVLVVETRHGDPVTRVQLPERATGAFTTIVAGAPVAGVILADPLGFVLF